MVVAAVVVVAAIVAAVVADLVVALMAGRVANVAQIRKEPASFLCTRKCPVANHSDPNPHMVSIRVH